MVEPFSRTVEKVLRVVEAELLQNGFNNIDMVWFRRTHWPRGMHWWPTVMAPGEVGVGPHALLSSEFSGGVY